MKKKSKDIKSFVENIRLKSTYCQININQIGELMDAIGEHFVKDNYMEWGEFVKLSINSLYGLCPKCKQLTTGDILFTVWSLKNPAPNSDAEILLRDYKAKSSLGNDKLAMIICQLVEAKCVKPCNSKKIEIHWAYMKGWMEEVEKREKKKK